MKNEKAALYSRLINSLYQISDELSEIEEKINAIPTELCTGIKFNDIAYESSTISSISNNTNASKNNISKIIRDLRKNLD